MKRGIGLISALLLCSLVVLALIPARAAAATTVTGFWPASGAVGNVIFVFGSGFDLTSNQVQINGIPVLLVQPISSDLLLFVLPGGNTNGPICVTPSPGTSVCSTLAFGTVLNGVNITALWPAQGKTNSIIFVFGSGFDPAPGKTQVSLAGNPLYAVQVIDPALLLFIVPEGAVSGPVTVTTPLGTATGAIPFIVFNPLPSGGVEYVYDELGRLTGVIDASGQSARYVYDPLGNVNPIARTGAGAVSLIEFTPNSGPAGTTVTILGTGFSATASQNTVKFNATAATVSSASATQLTVTVPIGATTGPISVTTPAGTASSTENFVVAAAVGAPTITGFTPAVGTVGTAVTITGTNFDPGFGATKVKFNQTSSISISGVTPTSVTAVVPANASFGKIQVTTINGTATSAEDFVLPPPGISPTDIIAIQRLDVAGAAKTLDVNATGKVGLLVFDGTQGNYLTLDLTAFTVNPGTSLVAYEIYAPGGVRLASGNVDAARRSIHIPVLPQTGTYSIYFKPGTATVNFTAALVADQALVVNGTSLNRTLGFTGQTSRLIFTGTAGQNLGLGLGGLSLLPAASSYANVDVSRPDGTSLTNTTCSVASSGCSFNLTNLPASGVYSVVLIPNAGATGSFSATLSTDLTGTLTANGSAQIFFTTRVGQNGVYSFVATNGQKLALSWPGSTIATGGLSVIAPNGNSLFSGVPLAGANALEWTAVAGMYQVFVDPSGVSTGSVSLQLAADLTGSLTIGGATTAVSLFPGQNARFSFTGTAGQNLGLGVSGFTTTPAGGSANISILGPTGAVLTSTTLTGSGAALNASALAASGAYTVVVDPVGTPSASFHLTLSPDIAGTLTANGPAATFSSARPGQNGRYTFSGTAGQGSAMLLSNSTLGASTLTVSGPSGVLGSTGLSQTGSFVLDLGTLPTTGTYTAFIDPAGVQTGAVTLAWVSDLTGTLVVNNATTTTISTAAGQNARYTFAGTAGSRYTVVATGISTLPAGGGVSVSVLDPAGNFVMSCGLLLADTTCDVPDLGSTGNYTVLVDAPGTSTATLSIVVKPEVTGTVTVDAATATATAFTAGQNVRLSFNNATAGATTNLIVSGLTMTPLGSQANLRVLDPTGINIFGNTYWIFTTSGYSIDLPVLNSTGNYTIEFDPVDFAAGSASFAIRTSIIQSISIDGPAVTVNWLANQQPVFNFATTLVNQPITLSFSGMSTTPAGGALRYSMSNAVSWTSNITAPGINLPQLPLQTIGDYSMTLMPQGTFSGAVTVALINDQTGTLTIGGAAVTHVPARAGQSKRFTFTNNTANRATTVRINSSQWTSGTWWLLAPTGGATLATFPTTTSAINYSVTLGSTGTYTLILVPAGASSGTVSVSVL